jgi:hypothetical protein
MIGAFILTPDNNNTCITRTLSQRKKNRKYLELQLPRDWQRC